LTQRAPERYSSVAHMWKRISGLEQILMDYVWAHAGATADNCREALAAAGRPLKESTVRTLLHRLEQKGYLKHEVDRRAYRYHAAEGRRSVAARAVKQIVDRFCDGSVEQLLLGMVEHNFVGREELTELARRMGKTRQR
jgi:BlaI family transcriptional regulator, penicillinase repressor